MCCCLRVLTLRPLKLQILRRRCMWLLQQGHTVVVKALLAARAVTSLALDNGQTPLFISAGKGHLAVVLALLKAHADVIAESDDGWTALHIAALNGHSEVVSVLIAAGADLAAKHNNG